LSYLKKADKFIEQYPLFRTEFNEQGERVPKVNEIGNFVVTLNKEFRAYARTIQGYKTHEQKTEEEDFSKWLEDNAKTAKRKKGKK
jgi:hypothetical protein